MSCEVWSRFQVTKEDGSLVKLRIQDLPENKLIEAVDLFTNFAYEETFHEAAGVRQNPKAVEQARQLSIEFMKAPAAHNTICCVDEDGGGIGQIVGVSATELVLFDSFEPPFKGTELEPEMQKLINLMDVMSIFYKIMVVQQLPRFYDDRGLYIHPSFRKLGIATEFFRTRNLACIARNVAATAALMTSTSSEKAAKKNCWENVLEINLDDLGHQHGVTFGDGAVAKFMIWRNPQFKIRDE